MKAGLTLPIKMRLYFQTLESLLNKQNTNYSKQQILDPVFITTFQKLNELEKVFYLHKMMTHLNFTLKSINNHEVKIY